MGSSDDRDRVTPVEPRKPFRPRLNTERAGVAPPGAGNRQPPRPIPRVDLDDTVESPSPWPKGKRHDSPPPQELPPPTSAQYGQRVAELSDEAQEQRERAERAEAALAREKRKSRPEPDSVPPRSRDLERLEARLDGKLADIAKEVAELRASQRSETTKVLVGAVVSIVLAVGGNRVIDAQGKPPPQIVVRRTAYDQKLEVCLAIKDDAAQVACLQRIVAEQADLRPK